MTQFKIDDRVRLIDNEGLSLPSGALGTVIEADGHWIDVDFDGSSIVRGLLSLRFEFFIRPVDPEDVAVTPEVLQFLTRHWNEDTDPVEVYLEKLRTSEVRVKDAGGSEKGQKASQLAAMDPLALLHLGEVCAMGASKYAAFNYLQSGYDWRLSFDAALRHLLAAWAGQDYDPESGLLHTAHAAWNMLAIVSFQLREIGTDSRFKQGEAAA